MSSIVIFVLIHLIAAVSCEWGCWSDWQACTRSCGTGTKRRTRSCIDQNSCIGSSSQEVKCNTQNCPVNGQWTNWSPWSVCSRSCSIGEYVRFRSCRNPPPSYGGVYCSGSTNETGFCNTHSCPNFKVDGQWGTWSEWLRCNASCGEGYKTRTRECNDPKPYYGGKHCSPPSYETIKCSANTTCSEKLQDDSSFRTIIIAVTISTVVVLSFVSIGIMICIKRKVHLPERKHSDKRKNGIKESELTETNSSITKDQNVDVPRQYEELKTSRRSNPYDELPEVQQINTESNTKLQTCSNAGMERQRSPNEPNIEVDNVNVVMGKSIQSTQPSSPYSNMLI